MENELHGYVPTHKELMRPTLRALEALGGSGSNEEIYDKLVEQQGYTEAVQNIMLPSGLQPKLWNRAAWARSFLKMAGALTNENAGTWALTQEAHTLTDEEIQERFKQRLKDNSEAKKLKKKAY